MNNNKKGILHPFIKYLIETKQLEIIIEKELNNSFIKENKD